MQWGEFSLDARFVYVGPSWNFNIRYYNFLWEQKSEGWSHWTVIIIIFKNISTVWTCYVLIRTSWLKHRDLLWKCWNRICSSHLEQISTNIPTLADAIKMLPHTIEDTLRIRRTKSNIMWKACRKPPFSMEIQRTDLLDEIIALNFLAPNRGSLKVQA